jgi:heat-inducible transcriptional repressor
MDRVNIENRKNKILYAIVEAYIGSAMPVGSRAVSQKFGKSVSSATIRNVMADLEELGLIMHPHTSAGRVPTDKGYRVYVDYLIQPKHLTKDEESLILKLVSHENDIEGILHSVSKAISLITNVAGIVVTPRLKRSVFRHIEFIPIDSSRILTVLMTQSGFIKNAILDLGIDLNREELVRIAEFLNHELEDMSLGEIKPYLTRRLLEEKDSFYTFLKKTIDILSMPNLLKMEGHLYYEGMTCMMTHPEFSDIKKARIFLKLFEDQKQLLDLLYEDMDHEGLKIHIGKENVFKDVQDCTVITCNYFVKNQIVGAIAAIGPTRMEYGKTISAIRYLSEILGKVLEQIG